MSADTFLWLLAQGLLLGVFVSVGIDAIRRPRRSTVDIALFFGLIAALVVLTDLPQLRHQSNGPWLDALGYALLSGLPYQLLRLVDDFSPQPRVVLLSSLGVVIALVVASFLVAVSPPLWFRTLPELWFIGLGGYATAGFMRQVPNSRGVTARRMLAVAIGSSLIGFALLLALIELVLPVTTPVVTLGIRLAALVAGVAYLIGFRPPGILRRAWQEPELRAFLRQAARLPRLADTDSIVHELEQGAAESTGAPSAVIGLWDPDLDVLRYRRTDGSVFETKSDELIGGITFTSGQALFFADSARADPEHADLYRRTASRAVLGAPITAGDRRLGVLLVYGARAPIFADEDLRLVQLLADQAAVVLESRMLIDTAASVRAREEATRLKDDFLSAAAHDLRSPITTLMLHAELLQRAMSKTSQASPDIERISAIVAEAKRLRELVSGFLDGMETERGSLVRRREPLDLMSLAEDVCRARSSPNHPCRVAAGGPVVGDFDRVRIRQVLENLVGNAIKYSPEGSEVVIAVALENQKARLSVTDHGIGIPSVDLPHVFDRFHRGGNVDDRRFHGLGLGLYICRAIVEGHGGRIWATSKVGEGSVFNIELPIRATATTPNAEPGGDIVESPPEEPIIDEPAPNVPQVTDLPADA